MSPQAQGRKRSSKNNSISSKNNKNNNTSVGLPALQSPRKPRFDVQPPTKPRLDPHERLLSRFYEPLILLHTLGKTRGEHTSAVLDVRRGFLGNLAYMCDYEKGGDTVTAIGLQSTPQGYVFWVAANSCPKKKIVPFLGKLLIKLKDISTAAGELERRGEDVAEECIQFANPRIKTYGSILRPLLKKCFQNLREREADEATELKLWLENFENGLLEPLVLCQFAYNNRKSIFMEQLRKLSVEPIYKSSEDAIHRTFGLVRHYIGRLGHHFRAAKELVSSASILTDLFDAFEVQPLPTPPKSAPPPIDGKTRLDSIIVRMLPSKSPELAYYQQALAELDATAQLYCRILEAYQNPNFRPRVHAEIQLLEHFYESKFSFAGSDRYIACSKPACYCCFLYIRHHPGNFVEPAAHCNIYLNWRPPDLKPDCEIASHHQRSILNSMIADIRKDALQQISQKRPPHTRHPDSATGITESIQAGQARELNMDLEEMELTDTSDDFELLLGEVGTTDTDTTDFKNVTTDFDNDTKIFQSRISNDFTVDNVRTAQNGDSAGSPDLVYSDSESDSESEGGVLL